MDGTDIFRKLIHGAKFDMKRFRTDAEKLKIVKQQPASSNNDLKQSEMLTGKDQVFKKQKEDNFGPPLKRAKHSVNLERKSYDDDDDEDDQDNDSDIEDDDDDASLDDDSNDIEDGDDGENNSDDDDDDYDDDDDGDDDDDDNEFSDSSMEQKENEKNNDELQILGNVRLSSKDVEEADLKNGGKAKKKNKNKNKVMTAEKAAQIQKEQVNHVRNVQHIHVHGTDIPSPVQTFSELQTSHGVNERILENVSSAGFVTPTPIEMQAMPVMLQRRELMACAPTGSGKTLAFVIPVLHCLSQSEERRGKKGGVKALILSPTRELARQTYNEFKRMGDGLPLRVHFISKTNKYEQTGNTSRGGAFKKYDIVVTTPNRLIYLLKQDPPVISLGSVEWLVVDECDKLFEEGKSGFRDQLAEIYKACDSQYVRRAMYSATFSHDVEEWCRLNLDNVVQVYVGARNSATQTVDQKLLYVGDESGKLLAIRDIIRQGLQPPVLIFVQSKERAKELFHELIYDGINVDVIHADRTQTQRDNSVACFRTGKIWVLICTELMGRGIDFKGVNLVINYDFPNSAVSYIHRIGRTGRAGRPGRAVTFFTDDDMENLRSIVNVVRGAGCEVPDYMLQIKAHGRKKKRKLAQTVPERETIATDLRYREKVKYLNNGKNNKKRNFQGKKKGGKKSKPKNSSTKSNSASDIVGVNGNNKVKSPSKKKNKVNGTKDLKMQEKRKKKPMKKTGKVKQTVDSDL